MKVFVTGGTGFVGKEVVSELCQAGHSVRLLVRNAAPGADQGKLEIISGNILEPDTFRHAMADCDAVIHLIGIIGETRTQTFQRIHVTGTQNVVAAAQAAGISRFIHMSALGTRANAVSRYHQTKWSAEEIVRQSGLPWTIFRPSLIFGPADRFVNLYARLLGFAPVVPLLGNPAVKFQPIAVHDVAAAFVQALSNPESIQKTYDLAGNESFTLKEIVKLIAKRSGHKAILWQVPDWLATSQAGFLEFAFGRILGKAPPLNRDQLLMLKENNTGDASAAIHAFGLQPIPFEQGIRQYVK